MSVNDWTLSKVILGSQCKQGLLSKTGLMFYIAMSFRYALFLSSLVETLMLGLYFCRL